MNRSKSDWLALIGEFEQSGLSAAAFCRERGVNPKYFSVRKKQLSSKFVQVKAAPVAARPTVTVKVVSFELPLSELSRCLNELV